MSVNSELRTDSLGLGSYKNYWKYGIPTNEMKFTTFKALNTKRKLRDETVSSELNYSEEQ